MKRRLTFIIFILCTLRVAAQNPPGETPKELLLAIKKSKPDTNQVKLLLQLGSYYLFKPGEFKNDLDSAMNNFDAALKLSQKCNFKKGELNTLTLIGNWNLEANDFEKAKFYYFKVVNEYHSTGDKLNEALTWKDLGDHIDYNDIPHLDDRESVFKHAFNLFKQIPGKQIDAINAYKEMADAQFNEGKYQLAETELLQVAAQFEKIHYVKIYRTYRQLEHLYRTTDNFEKQLYYAIACVKSMDMDPSADPCEKQYNYFDLGLAYIGLREFDQAILYLKKSLELDRRFNCGEYYNNILEIIYAQEALKKPAEALSFLRLQEHIAPPKTDEEKRWVAEATLKINSGLKRYDEAAKALPCLIKYYSELEKKMLINKSDEGVLNEYSREVALVGTYYVATGQNRKAVILFDKILALPQQKISLYNKIINYIFQYKIDSIQGNYRASLEHFKKMAFFKDSVNFYEKNKVMAKMYASFKTFQKEQSIKDLNKKNVDQRDRLHEASIRQKYAIGAVGMFFIIAVVAFIGFRNKQISNRKLKAQQMMINRQNDSLNHLLTEKEWLLKEVHHRVKNNLHTVICLLESQARYLENDALKAIESSQHRIYAMSLIHQKLYQSDDIKTIDMANYIPELVKSLEESFDTSDRIKFKLNIDKVNLDISHAIPLGLIINEAVTNSIKYAFPDSRKGEISISMLNYGDHIKLELADNGVGMPEIDVEFEPESLGLRLMKGLSEDIDADICFEVENGTRISIKFEHDALNDQENFLKLADTKEIYV